MRRLASSGDGVTYTTIRSVSMSNSRLYRSCYCSLHCPVISIRFSDISLSLRQGQSFSLFLLAPEDCARSQGVARIMDGTNCGAVDSVIMLSIVYCAATGQYSCSGHLGAAELCSTRETANGRTEAVASTPRSTETMEAVEAGGGTAVFPSQRRAGAKPPPVRAIFPQCRAVAGCAAVKPAIRHTAAVDGERTAATSRVPQSEVSAAQALNF